MKRAPGQGVLITNSISLLITRLFRASISLFLLLFINLFIYFLVVLGLRCCVWAFSSCGERGPLLVVVRGPLIKVASPVVEHAFQARGLQ